MVGHYNTPSLAAASFVNSVFNLFLFLTMGYSYGLTPLAGRLFGQRQYRRAGALLKEAVCTNALYGILIIIGLLLVYSQVSHMGQDPKLLPLIRPYFLIMVGSMPFVILFNLLRQFTDAATDTAVAMWILLSSNVLNIVGNYLLINGIGPLPELGLNGAGLSTLLARAYTAVALTLFLLRSPRLPRRPAGLANLSRQPQRHPQHQPLLAAHLATNGYGDGCLYAKRHHGGVAGRRTAGRLSGHHYHQHAGLPVLLQFRGQHLHTHLPFCRTEQLDRSATCLSGRPQHPAGAVQRHVRTVSDAGPWLVDSFTPDAPYAVWGMPCCCRWCSISWATPCKYATPTACAARRMCSRWPGLPASAIWRQYSAGLRAGHCTALGRTGYFHGPRAGSLYGRPALLPAVPPRHETIRHSLTTPSGTSPRPDCRRIGPPSLKATA